MDFLCFFLGYRYELYCASKSARTTQCTIFCAISTQDAWSLNEKRTTIDEISTEDHTQKDGNDSDDAPDVGNSLVPYTREIFDALILRFEEPNANNRWDSPMFTILPDTKINLDDVYSALYEKKPPPPNQATQNVSTLKGAITKCFLIIFYTVVPGKLYGLQS